MAFRARKVFGTFEKRAPGACFSKVPKHFGRISGDIILFVPSKRRRLEARTFAVIFIFIPFTTCEKISFTEYAGSNFTNGFSGPESSRDFRETGPRPHVLTGRGKFPWKNVTELPKKEDDIAY